MGWSRASRPACEDITERIQLTAELEGLRRTQARQYLALARSNRDLEQFAFVASHDLSEPLRAMTGFVQLLEKRYSDVLDDRGRRYVSHIVDGSARMRMLIEDLLEYSRYLLVDPRDPVGWTPRRPPGRWSRRSRPRVEIGDLPDGLVRRDVRAGGAAEPHRQRGQVPRARRSLCASR